MEPANEKHIQDLRIVSDIDRKLLRVNAGMADADDADMLEVKVFDEGKLVATGKSINQQGIEIPMPADCKLWSPDSPFLYTLQVTLKSGGKVVDQDRKSVV